MKLLEKIDLDSLIDQNIHLIDTGKFEEFYDVCKAQLKRKDLILLTDLLAEEGIELPHSITGFLYGIKSSTHTLSLRAPTSPTEYGVDFTSNQGMRGGHQIGFESRKAAQNYIDDFYGPSSARVSIILPETVAGYTWKQIQIPGSIAFATTSAIQSFKPYMDPDQKKISRLKTRYTNEINKLEKELTAPEKIPDIRKLTANKNTAIAEEMLEKLRKYVENTPEEYFVDPTSVRRDLSLLDVKYLISYCISVFRDDIRISLYIEFNSDKFAKKFELGLKKIFPDSMYYIDFIRQYINANTYCVRISTPYIIDSTLSEALAIIDKKTKKVELLKQKLAAI